MTTLDNRPAAAPPAPAVPAPAPAPPAEPGMACWRCPYRHHDLAAVRRCAYGAHTEAEYWEITSAMESAAEDRTDRYYYSDRDLDWASRWI